MFILLFFFPESSVISFKIGCFMRSIHFTLTIPMDRQLLHLIHSECPGVLLIRY